MRVQCEVHRCSLSVNCEVYSVRVSSEGEDIWCEGVQCEGVGCQGVECEVWSVACEDIA